MANTRSLITRIVSYWRPFRAVLLVAAAGGFVLAVAIDNAVVAALSALVGLGALAVLLALVGSRVDDQHQELGDVAKVVRDRQRSVGTASERDLFRRSTGGRGVSLLLPVQPKTDPTKMVRHLSDHLPAAEIVLIDRTGGDGLQDALFALAELAPDLIYVASHASHDVLDDLNDARGVATGRHLIVVGRTLGVGDVPDVARLASDAPEPDEPWVGARRSSTRTDLSLVSAAAMREVGGWVDTVAIDASLTRRLVEAGYVVDAGGRSETGRVAHRLALGSFHTTEPHALHNGIGLLVDETGATSVLVALVDALISCGEVPVVLIDAERWPALRASVLQVAAPVMAMPSAGEWMESARALVEVADSAEEPHRALAVFAGYGRPAFRLAAAGAGEVSMRRIDVNGASKPMRGTLTDAIAEIDRA